MRHGALAMVAGWLLLGTGLAREVRDDCGLKVTEKGVWCEKCDKLLEKADVKDGKHKECEEKPKEVLVCVKKCYEGCHKGPQEKPYS